MKKFSNTWFDDSELKKNIHRYLDPNEKNIILEIGCFEGEASCYFADTFLNKDGSLLICVDPFDISDTTAPVYDGIFETFIRNISTTKNWTKIRTRKMKSDDFFKTNVNTFNFIYIDGSHLPEDVENDFKNALNCIKLNGYICLDDYLWEKQPMQNSIDKIYEQNKDKLEIVYKGYQIVFKKIL